MRIATWNVNSLKARQDAVERWLERADPDVLLMQETKLPDQMLIIPGVIDNTTNVIEHPELVAERLLRYARLVGRENVIAGVDCGFGTAVQTMATVDPMIAMTKLRMLSEGAALASRELWS